MSDLSDTKETYWSNCLIEALRAKIKYGKHVRLIFIKPWVNEIFCPHFMWHDLRDGNIYDFHCPKMLDSKWGEVWFKGYIRCRPYKVYEYWKRTKSWSMEE